MWPRRTGKVNVRGPLSSPMMLRMSRGRSRGRDAPSSATSRLGSDPRGGTLDFLSVSSPYATQHAASQISTVWRRPLPVGRSSRVRPRKSEECYRSLALATANAVWHMSGDGQPVIALEEGAAW